jgi:antitoxin CptB
MEEDTGARDEEVVAEHREPLALRRKRLRFRSCHRGMKELDVLLGRFVERHLDNLTTAQLDRYESLIESPDPDLYRWILGRGAAPAIHDTDVMALLRDIRYSP